MTAKFNIGDVVEQVNLGDLPCMVDAVKDGHVPRYLLSAINGDTYENIPEYMIVKARPAATSRWRDA